MVWQKLRQLLYGNPCVDSNPVPALMTPIGAIGIARQYTASDAFHYHFNPFGNEERQRKMAADKALWANQLISDNVSVNDARVRHLNANLTDKDEAYRNLLSAELHAKFNAIDLEGAGYTTVLIPLSVAPASPSP